MLIIHTQDVNITELFLYLQRETNKQGTATDFTRSAHDFHLQI